MSLWSPTHIQVTIHSARGLLIKGKSGTNNCFVTIVLGKEKFQTSLLKNAGPNVEWREECELRIPNRGNRAELILTCLHKSTVVDDFLGQVTLPLNEMDVYERPRQRWYRLESKPGQEKKDKQRGELEVRIAFIVHPESGGGGSTADLSKRGSRLSALGGSLLSLGVDGEKRSKMKGFAKSLGSRMHINAKTPKKESANSSAGDGADSLSGGSSLSVTPKSATATHQQQQAAQPRSGQLAAFAAANHRPANIDPGVHSDDEDDDFRFDNMSHKSSGSSLNIGRSNQQLGSVHVVHALPPPSPLSIHSSTDGQRYSQPAAATSAASVAAAAAAADIKMRSQTLPAQSKPKRRATPEPPEDFEAEPQPLQQAQPPLPPPPPSRQNAKPDEWEAKLYGKHLDIGSSADSLKRRSWESSRVIPISAGTPSTAAASASPEHVLASTAPTTPNLEDQKRAEQIEKPRPLARSATLESIEEQRDQAAAAAAAAPALAEKPEKRFLHKLKYFQRKDRAESAEDLKSVGMLAGGGRVAANGAAAHGFGGERIIIGHENDLVRRGGGSGASGGSGGGMEAMKVPQALVLKYEGKSREEMMVLANDLENEVKSQKLKMKEMEDYLDDLLLRVMETHPKILQNPYRNQMSAKR